MGDVGGPRRWLSAVGLLALLAVAIAGSAPRARLEVAGGPLLNYSVQSIAHLQPHHLVSVGEMVVCASGPGAVTITSVTPVNPVGGIRVKAFAVRRNPNDEHPPQDQLGDDRRPLSAVGFGHSHAVNTVCGADPGAGYELGLELVKPSPAPASAAGWQIRYRSGDGAGTMTFPFGMVLCSRLRADAPECRRLTRRLIG